MVKKINPTFIIAALCILLIGTLSVIDNFSSSFSGESARLNKKNQVQLQLKSYKGVNFDFTTTTSNTKHKLSQFKNKIIIVNFWATWCGPCLTELPMILKIMKDYPDKVVLVAVSNEKKEVINNFFYKKFVEWDVKSLKNVYIVTDKELALKRFNVMVFPETFVYDKNFNIVHKVIGASEWKTGKVLQLIKKLL